MIMLVGHIIIILGSSYLTHLCFAQTALFLVLVAVFQSHSVAGLLTDDEKSLYFGLEEEGKYFLYTSIFVLMAFSRTHVRTTSRSSRQERKVFVEHFSFQSWQ